MATHLHIDQDALAAFCRLHKIVKLSLFGSVLRDDFRLDRSDVDVLVEFAPGAESRLSYFDLARMQHELEALFSLPVDLSLADALDPDLSDTILATAQVQYDAA